MTVCRVKATEKYGHIVLLRLKETQTLLPVYIGAVREWAQCKELATTAFARAGDALPLFTAPPHTRPPAFPHARCSSSAARWSTRSTRRRRWGLLHKPIEFPRWVARPLCSSTPPRWRQPAWGVACHARPSPALLVTIIAPPPPPHPPPTQHTLTHTHTPSPAAAAPADARPDEERAGGAGLPHHQGTPLMPRTLQPSPSALSSACWASCCKQPDGAHKLL